MPFVYVPTRDRAGFDDPVSIESSAATVAIEYFEYGKGPILVLLIPGMCVPSAMYDNLAGILASDNRFTAICVENRGMKGSGWAEGGWTVSRLAADAWAVVEAVRTSRDELPFPRIAVVGHSMGGMVAQRVAAQRPTEVGLLACISSHSGGTWNLLPSRGLLVAFARLAWSGFKPHVRAAVSIGLHFSDRFLDSAERRRAELLQRYLVGASDDYISRDTTEPPNRNVENTAETVFRGHFSVIWTHSLSYLDALLLADCRRIFKVVVAGRGDCVVVPSSSRRLANAIDADMIIETEGAHFILEEAQETVALNLLLALNIAFGNGSDSSARVLKRCECYTCNPTEQKRNPYLQCFRMC